MKWVERMAAARARGDAVVEAAEARWAADHELATANKQGRFERAAKVLLAACEAADKLATEQASSADAAAAAIAARLEEDLPAIREAARQKAMEQSTVLELADWSAGKLPFPEHSVDRLLLPNSVYFLPNLDAAIQVGCWHQRPGTAGQSPH